MASQLPALRNCQVEIDKRNESGRPHVSLNASCPYLPKVNGVSTLLVALPYPYSPERRSGKGNGQRIESFKTFFE
ncbi:hypothetical protein HBI31_078240 [Parastagonospora nodorum]|nr:hypothetical protein HBH49_142740 [Parastagonospora nodorum]KAH5500306.1 hypothetical protein HBI31_078240 [Parastagonospora nodorum]KAH6398429.1 hypothetical protein HBI60_096250 [Parastagonospora nodorum]